MQLSFKMLRICLSTFVATIWKYSVNYVWKTFPPSSRPRDLFPTIGLGGTHRSPPHPAFQTPWSIFSLGICMVPAFEAQSAAWAWPLPPRDKGLPNPWDQRRPHKQQALDDRIYEDAVTFCVPNERTCPLHRQCTQHHILRPHSQRPLPGTSPEVKARRRTKMPFRKLFFLRTILEVLSGQERN